MKVILFGATGMVGQGVLRECLLDRDVERVLVIGRTELGQEHAKLRELVLPDLFDLSDVEGDLSGHDACLFCLGVSAAGLSEAKYRRVTFDLTLAVAQSLIRLNPQLTFIYVSGSGTSTTGSAMWARVKGETENALLALPFKATYLFRPGFIQPLHGITSKTKLYRMLYVALAPLYPIWKTLFPRYVSTTEQVGRAMLEAAKHGAPKPKLENADINALAERSGN